MGPLYTKLAIMIASTLRHAKWGLPELPTCKEGAQSRKRLDRSPATSEEAALDPCRAAITPAVWPITIDNYLEAHRVDGSLQSEGDRGA